MKDIRHLKTELKKEFPIVYEWTDAPNTVYEPHAHQGRVSFYITDGEIVMDFNGEKKHLKGGDRFDVPVKTKHSALVGENGVSYVVGQDIEGDA
jgi:quercetin dioxygenase-like cupin family protein